MRIIKKKRIFFQNKKKRNDENFFNIYSVKLELKTLEGFFVALKGQIENKELRFEISENIK